MLATLLSLAAPGLSGTVGSPLARAYSNAPSEILVVPSAAMARDVRVQFLDGGPGSHALYLLDSMEAAMTATAGTSTPPRSTGTRAPEYRW